MKFKEDAIKPGMVIHCPTEEDARALLEHLERTGYNVGNVIKERAFAEYGDQTCFYTNSPSQLFYGDRPYVSYGDIGFYTKDEDFKGITITEFSDLIEPDDISDWYEEMESDSPMTAVEVLEWLMKYRGKMKFKECFGRLYAMDILFNLFTADEILDKITAYEATKKAPKPVEVEWVKLFRIIQIQDNGTKKCVYEEEANPYVAYGTGEEGNYSFDPKYGAENVLKKYVSEHDGRYIVVIEDVCRVKEDES